MDPIYFVTGMYRAGTSWVARILGAHPRVAFASEPFGPIFRAFRLACTAGLPGAGTDGASPLRDYYMDPEALNLMMALQRGSLERSLGNLDLRQLKEQVQVACASGAPRLIPYLDHLVGATYQDLFRSAFHVVKLACGGPEAGAIGLEEIGSAEYARHLLNGFPKARVIHVIRDVRSVAASCNSAPSHKLPWLFVARQWRKLATFSWRDSREPAYRQRVYLLKFEQLAQDLPGQIHKLCQFLDLDYHEAMLQATELRQGESPPPDQERLHARQPRPWEEVLQPREQALLEHLCRAELGLFDYPVSGPAEFPLDLLWDPPLLEREVLAPWIRPFVPTTAAELRRELALEKLRSDMLARPTQRSLTEQRLLTLVEALYQHLAMGLI